MIKRKFSPNIQPKSSEESNNNSDIDLHEAGGRMKKRDWKYLLNYNIENNTRNSQNSSKNTEDLNQNEIMQFEDFRRLKKYRTSVALYKGQLVAVKSFQRKRSYFTITRLLKLNFQILKELNHENLNKFLGACIYENQFLILLTQYHSRGSLADILQDETIQLNSIFISSLVSDLIKGLVFLHQSAIGFHGSLKPAKCLVDSRWVLKLTDFGLHYIKNQSEIINHENINAKERKQEEYECMNTYCGLNLLENFLMKF